MRTTFSFAIAICFTLAFAATGCATASSGGAMSPSGYRQGIFGYGVAYRDANSKALVGPDWQIDNYRRDPNFDAYQEKLGDDYVAIREEDVDADGTVSDFERKLETIYDLRFVSRANNGVMWVKAHPFLPEEADRSLEVILDAYADSLAGSGRYAQGNLFGIRKVAERNFTSFLTSKSLVQLGGHPALAGSIELAEVDRLKADPNHRSGKLRLVLVKLRCYSPATCRKLDAPSAPRPLASGPLQGQGKPADYKPMETLRTGAGPATIDDVERWPLVDCRGGTKCHARVGLLVIGYYNTPTYFDEGMPEFDDLIKRLSFTDAEPLSVPPPKATASAPSDSSVPK